ncbi:MAG: PepSY domain-containing protein [Nevskiaceae bacterium]|jgi:hypothetical protein|nr:PepSY domain-containing protein [Nevskiaceae bacterium]
MLLRAIQLIHRYLAVAVSVLIAIWCLSGFVMMYQSFPAFTPAERLQTLAPLELTQCCAAALLGDDNEPLRSFRIEMLQGEPVLRQPGVTPVKLRDGQPLEPLTQAGLLGVAAQYAAGRKLVNASPTWLREVNVDQWSIQIANPYQPLQHLALGDKAGSQIYVDASTGEILQDTNRRERVLTWFGAIPHWFYPTVLRRNGPLWSQIVIWTAVIGVFLTLTGLYLGITSLRRKRDGRLSSPFRGIWYWHHLLGLSMGLLTLTWVFSGMMTMNPWGLLFGDGGAAIRTQWRGASTHAQLRQFLESAPASIAPAQFVQLQGDVVAGELQVLAFRADGSVQRLNAAAQPDPLDGETMERWVRALNTGVESFTRMEHPDTYFYGHKVKARLPVYRAILADAGRTRLYIDPDTASLRVVDASVRQSRWLISAMHDIDLPVLRNRPVWDVLVLLLLGGVTALALTGCWMALKIIIRSGRKS